MSKASKEIVITDKTGQTHALRNCYMARDDRGGVVIYAADSTIMGIFPDVVAAVVTND